MFNALENFESLSTKQKMLALLDVAEVILEHDARIDGDTLDDVELADADGEDAFEDVRSALRTAAEKVDYYID